MLKFIFIIFIFFTNISEAKIQDRSSFGQKKINIQNIQSLKPLTLEQKAENLAKELQNILAAKLLNTMYEGIKPDPVFGGGFSEKAFQTLLNDERAKFIDLGLVKPLKKQIISLNKHNRGVEK